MEYWIMNDTVLCQNQSSYYIHNNVDLNKTTIIEFLPNVVINASNKEKL